MIEILVKCYTASVYVSRMYFGVKLFTYSSHSDWIDWKSGKKEEKKEETE